MLIVFIITLYTKNTKEYDMQFVFNSLMCFKVNFVTRYYNIDLTGGKFKSGLSTKSGDWALDSEGEVYSGGGVGNIM